MLGWLRMGIAPPRLPSGFSTAKGALHSRSAVFAAIASRRCIARHDIWHWLSKPLRIQELRLPLTAGNARYTDENNLIRRYSPFQKARDDMQQAIAALMVTLVCLAGALAALSERRRTEEAGPSRSPRWQVAALGSAALAVAVVVLTIYLRE